MIERKGDGLIMVTGSAGLFIGLWTLCKARPRGLTRCLISGRAITNGMDQYRPMTNGGRRMQRMRADVVDTYIEKWGKK